MSETVKGPQRVYDPVIARATPIDLSVPDPDVDDTANLPAAVTSMMPVATMTHEEFVAEIRTAQERHRELLQKYHELWYTSHFTLVWTGFLGVPLIKCPNDLWSYQELINEFRFKTIIETGTYCGGSALWFAFIMDALGIEGGKIFTIDIEDKRKCSHPRITFLTGDSRSVKLAAALAEQVTHPLLVTLDADHGEDHVYRELCLYAPMTNVGDWIVVEDTNVSWPGEEGARGGCAKYLREHPGEFEQSPIPERFLLTMHPGGWLQRVHACEHDHA